jgi:hypothetical protein
VYKEHGRTKRRKRTAMMSNRKIRSTRRKQTKRNNIRRKYPEGKEREHGKRDR